MNDCPADKDEQKGDFPRTQREQQTLNINNSERKGMKIFSSQKHRFKY